MDRNNNTVKDNKIATEKETTEEKKKKSSALSTVVSVVAIVLCVIFGLMLLFNLTIIFKGLIHPDTPPSVFGITPLIVRSRSMSNDQTEVLDRSRLEEGLSAEEIDALEAGKLFSLPIGEGYDYKVEYEIISTEHDEDGSIVSVIVKRPVEDHIEMDDLIIVKKIDAKELKVGDIISFVDPDSKSNELNTHRIVKISQENGKLLYTTRGDFNDKIDPTPVSQDNVIGIYKSRIPAIGSFILFLQQPLGMALFIGVPVIAFVVFDIIRRSRINKEGESKNQQLEEELERLRALAKEQEEANNAKDSEKPGDLEKTENIPKT